MPLQSKTVGTRSSRDFIEELNRLGVDPNQSVHEAEIARQMRELTGKIPRKGQVLALYHLLHGKQDILFQAATGYGKSMIWQCAPLIGDGIALMISPLNMLTDEQVALLPGKSNGQSNGIGLTAQNNNDDTYEEIAKGKYTHGMWPTYLIG